jgi:aspartyl-tRNA(Asn)/glutamyl-tRNA(Gln) amidotransferase subunit A
VLQNAKYSAWPLAIGNARAVAPQGEIMSSDLPFHSLAVLSRMLARGETTSRAIVEACLARIDAHDGHLHAFIDVYRDDALAAADVADRRRREGTARGALAGLPIALKDLLHIEGRETTAGSKSWRGRISEYTATAVLRLEAAGMIPLGKTHMVEFAFGGWGRNAPMGAPWNPWDATTHRVAGGSSSGSAVAVAGGLCPAAIGSDTGGSIRIPASLCGITRAKAILRVSPARLLTSEGLMPEVRSRTRTSPRAGSGISASPTRSTSRAGPFFS